MMTVRDLQVCPQVHIQKVGCKQGCICTCLQGRELLLKPVHILLQVFHAVKKT